VRTVPIEKSVIQVLWRQQRCRESIRQSPPSTRTIPTSLLSLLLELPDRLGVQRLRWSQASPDLDDQNLVIVDISNFTITKIVDKRPGPSGVEYKYEFQPLWWAAESAETAQMGHVRIRNYENGLVRLGRLKTLRERKRKFSQV
jgi:hypothetical protein